MKRGWLLDVHPDYENDLMVSWLRTEGGVESFTDTFHPTFYVHGDLGELEGLRKRLEILSAIEDMRFVHRKIHLGKGKRTKLLAVTRCRDTAS